MLKNVFWLMFKNPCIWDWGGRSKFHVGKGKDLQPCSWIVFGWLNLSLYFYHYVNHFEQQLVGKRDSLSCLLFFPCKKKKKDM